MTNHTLDLEHYTLNITSFDSSNIKAQCPALVLIHGAIENAKIFYSKSQKGLAPFLASKGFHVFVLDMRGKGKSKPKISKHSTFGTLDQVQHDFTALYSFVKTHTNHKPQVWLAHSWGGVLLLHFWARFHKTMPIEKMVFFGSKRRISVKSIKKWLMINFFWRYLGTLLAKIYGYYPSKTYKLGSENESTESFLEMDRMVLKKAWVDVDGFDYHKYFKAHPIDIPIFSMTGQNDDVLGHAHDCKALLKEAGATKSLFKVIGKQTGYKVNYDHINLLTHPKAKEEHFLEVIDFIQS